MTNRELISILAGYPLDTAVLLSKEHIDDMGNKCTGYVFPIDGVDMNNFGLCIYFADVANVTECKYTRK